MTAKVGLQFRSVFSKVTHSLQIRQSKVWYNYKQMKYLVLLAIITLVVAKETVRAEDNTMMDQIKLKARQIYKQFDTDANGEVSMKEVADGINRGLGFGDSDEFSSSTNYVKQIYDKYISGKNSQCLKEQDFDEIFASHHCASGKLKSAKKSVESTFETLRNNAEQIYSKFDKNGDNHVSLDEVQEGLKAGLGFDTEESTKDESSIKQYANELYEKYVKSDSKDKDSFTKADFYDILNDRNQKSLLGRIKEKASQMHESLDEDQDGHVSLGQVEQGIREGLGLKEKPSEKIEQAAKSASAKASKAKKTIKKEAKKAAKKAKEEIVQKSQQIKDSIEQASETVSRKASEMKDAAVDRASQTMETIKEGLESAKNSAQQAGEAIIDKAAEVKKTTMNKAKKLTKKASKVGEEIMNKAQSAKDTIKEVGESIKEGVSSAIQTGEQGYETLKQKASEIYDRFDQNGDNSVSFDELKSSIKESLGFSNQSDDEDEKTLWESISGMFAGKQLEKAKSYTKEEFNKALGFAKKQKSFLEQTKQKGKQIHQRLDANKDGYVSLQEIANGVKQGLGLADESKKSEDSSIMSYISGLYQTYVKPDAKDKKGLTVNNFCEMIRKRQRESKKSDCESASLLNLEELKARACDIHEKFDKNNDGQVTMEEAAEGIKSKIGFGKDEEIEQFSLWSYVKSLYEKQIQLSNKRELKLSKDDFTDIIYEWKSQCPAHGNRKQIMTE